MTDPFFFPVSGFDLPRYAGIPTFMRLPHVGLDDPRIRQVRVGLIGLPWDGGTTNRPGPRHGPRQLRDASTVLGLEPDFVAMRGLELGVIGAHDPEQAQRIGAAHEVRAFCPGYGMPEDPVTGSLNAGFAVWLVGEGVLPASYVVRQGTAMGRDGRVHVRRDAAGALWVGGSTRTVAAGHVDL